MLPKPKPNLRIRKVKPSDAARLLSWRNDPVTRRNSFSSKKIGRKEHREWLGRTLASHDRILLIAVRLKSSVGVLRYDFLGSSKAEVNINLAPRERGKGWGAKILRKGNQWMARKTSVKRVLARIKKENKPSQNAFLKAGFRFFKAAADHDLYVARLS